MSLSGFPVTIKPRDVVFSLSNLQQISAFFVLDVSGQFFELPYF